MSNLVWLTGAKSERREPFLPKSHGTPRGHWVEMVRLAEGLWPASDDLKPLEAVGRHGFLRPDDGEVSCEGGEGRVIVIDATYLKAHRTASSLRAKRRAR